MSDAAKPAVIAYLLGQGELDGRWFGDPPPPGKGRYWWRKALREVTLPAPKLPAAVPVEFGEL